MIWEVHQSAPVGYLAKEVEAVVDDSPILTLAQRDLFTWMAQHYMCSLGEMGAALPAGMKLESTTRIVLHPDAHDASEEGLDPSAMMLLDALHVREDMGIEIALSCSASNIRSGPFARFCNAVWPWPGRNERTHQAKAGFMASCGGRRHGVAAVRGPGMGGGEGCGHGTFVVGGLEEESFPRCKPKSEAKPTQPQSTSG